MPYHEPAIDEQEVVFIEYGYIHKIINLIHETNLVSDTRKEKRNKTAMKQVKEALNRSV